MPPVPSREDRTMRRTILRRTHVRFLLLLLPTVVAGCDAPGSGTVTGRVTIKRIAPKVANLTVSVLASSGQSLSAPISPDGSYSVSDVPAGPVLLGVSVVDTEPQLGAETSPAEGVDQKKLDPRRLNRRAPLRQPFAEKYVNPRTSGFAATVESGKVVVL